MVSSSGVYSALAPGTLAGIRDVLIHNYMGIDLDMVWAVIEKDLVVLKESINEIVL